MIETKHGGNPTSKALRMAIVVPSYLHSCFVAYGLKASLELRANLFMMGKPTISNTKEILQDALCTQVSRFFYPNQVVVG
jgi:hypothetical protein